MKTIVLFLSCCMLLSVVSSQTKRWQQRVKYSIDVNMDVTTNRFTGKEKIEYINNSPDTLKKLFIHLYWNAFQPNSMMDTRSRKLGETVIRKDKNGNDVRDWDSRVKDRILNLKPDEIGFQQVTSLKINGVEQLIKEEETILAVNLSKPILPAAKVVLDVAFNAQVPLQIRRSGRDNADTKVRYSMSQWYPKICEYDYEGWHPTPYVAREFYGVWGDYEVKITIDKNYIIGGSGYLQNANQIGYGYETPGTKVTLPAGDKLTWIFTAPNVHDFMWAADNDYAHESKQVKDGPLINIFYKKSTSDTNKWRAMLDSAVMAYPYIKETFGTYPYKQFSFVHGGDGGMEYPMSTLIKSSGTGTAIHEWMHSWYQGMLATNESEYSWMDEGFTQYAEDRVMAYLKKTTDFAQQDSYLAYFELTKSNRAEPLTTHADHFESNYAYGRSAYSKGAVFLEQLGYIIGNETRDKVLIEYYNQWKFKHPNANDFIRVAEKVSGIQLDWYKEYWINTTKTINYAIDSLWEEGGKTKIRLRNLGLMPMPVDVQLTFKDGSKEIHYVPMYLMFGEKPNEDNSVPRKVYEAWKWTDPTYIIETDKKILTLKEVEIDPSLQMADIDRRNNLLELNW
ncbi:MAG: M1 family metallopeptidase [Sphingobacteriales bacterium]|nr:M1 family metallopeptidase [Sphingobacteriales bacterium]MBI3717274.1 M1 family metallopeptidase [Sphingobacteriales bacterium]